MSKKNLLALTAALFLMITVMPAEHSRADHCHHLFKAA